MHQRCIHRNWDRVTDPTKYCSYTDAPLSAGINTNQAVAAASQSISTSQSVPRTNALTTQAARRRRAANLYSRALQQGRMTKVALNAQRAGVTMSQSNGCSVFGPSRNVQTGFSPGAFGCAMSCLAAPL